MLDHSFGKVNFSIEELAMQAYLQITLKIADKNREAAAGVYTKYKAPFLNEIAGAESKALLIRDEDVLFFMDSIFPSLPIETFINCTE